MSGITASEIWKTACENNIPIGVIFELTHRCNLHCGHCYLVKTEGNAEGRELSLSEYKSIIDQLEKEKTMFLVFTGGEILLKREWFGVARYAREKGFVLFFLTNGTLINEGAAKKIKSLNPFRVEMSIYGADAETHEAVTGVKGSFAKTLNGARLLAEKGVMVVMKSVLMKRNIGEQDRIRELVEGTGANYGINPFIFPGLDGSRGPLSMRVSASELRNFYRWHLDKEKDLESISAVSLGGQNVISCSVAAGAFVVNPYGDMTPCIRIPVKMGSLREQSFREIWENSPVLLDLRKKRREPLQKCAGCRYLKYCNRCPGIAYLEDGGLACINEQTCIAAKIRTEEVEAAIKRKKCRGKTGGGEKV